VRQAPLSFGALDASRTGAIMGVLDVGCKTSDVGEIGMAERKALQATLRPKRQITLPREVCERMGIQPGDVLELELQDSRLVATPRKVRALEDLREIREAFQRSGITEEELQETGRRVREEVYRELYGSGA